MPCVVIMSAGRVPLVVDVKSRVGCVHALLVQEVYAKIIRTVVVRDAISISRPGCHVFTSLIINRRVKLWLPAFSGLNELSVGIFASELNVPSKVNAS